MPLSFIEGIFICHQCVSHPLRYLEDCPEVWQKSSRPCYGLPYAKTTNVFPSLEHQTPYEDKVRLRDTL